MKIILLILVLSISLTELSFSQSLTPLKLSDLKNNSNSFPVNITGSSDYKKELSDQIFITYNYIQNLGRFKDYYKDGTGFTINYGKYFPNSWLAVARTGYFKQNLREGVDSGGYKNFGVLPFHVGGRFYVYKNVFMPYFSFMNGINIISASDFVGNDSPGDKTEIRYAFQVGFGFDVKFTKNFGINASINYNNSFWEDYDIYDQQNSEMMTGFEYVGGLTYNFNK